MNWWQIVTTSVRLPPRVKMLNSKYFIVWKNTVTASDRRVKNTYLCNMQMWSFEPPCPLVQCLVAKPQGCPCQNSVRLSSFYFTILVSCPFICNPGLAMVFLSSFCAPEARRQVFITDLPATRNTSKICSGFHRKHDIFSYNKPCPFTLKWQFLFNALWTL